MSAALRPFVAWLGWQSRAERVVSCCDVDGDVVGSVEDGNIEDRDGKLLFKN